MLFRTHRSIIERIIAASHSQGFVGPRKILIMIKGGDWVLCGGYGMDVVTYIVCVCGEGLKVERKLKGMSSCRKDNHNEKVPYHSTPEGLLQ